MEVAGQWRREWAGTAEYGKVIEGGVTRRVARAMEVLQTSGPGARVRVLRAAYHSTAGPGAPASSFMIHSSRRVISSGSSFLETPAFATPPLEISSMPLESSPERSSDTENYKVTEPDDTETSQPSKWKTSTTTASIRLPSEESSSIDNASIVDVDTTMNTMKHINILRKSSLDSDISDSIQSYRRNTSRASPHIDTPVTLSTLKYKSLLNGNNNSWNDRRKSYSFEDTSPIQESISKDTLGMESSTDSGICKSTEKVNENDDTSYKPPYSDFSPIHKNESRFKDWLASNRPNKLLRVTREKTHWEEPAEYSDDNVSLQSKGKFSIALQQNDITDNKFQYSRNYLNEFERKIKKVGFSKTELHFAAESGRVNIISTDDKPPPSNDFRRRRSAFVPLKEKFEKPITLFGEKSNNFTPLDEYTSNYNESNEIEESTVSAKSILKNKIPKPKPYLLGENMEFRETDDQNNRPVITSAVSLINSQLQKQDFRYSPIVTEQNEDEENMVVIQHPIRIESRAVNNGHSINTTDHYDIPNDDNISETRYYTNSTHTNSVKQKLRNIPSSPVLNERAKTRHLRDSELTYFGVGNESRNKHITGPIKTTTITKPRSAPSSDADDYFRSVKLVQQVSNSVSNSEAESEDNPEYQNIPFKAERMPVPTPKPRSKYFNDIDNELSGRMVVLKPIIEQDTDMQVHNDYESRRSRSKRNQQDVSIKSRSISEPPKYRKQHTSSSAIQDRSKSPQSPWPKLNGYPGYLSPTFKEEFHSHNINSNYKNTNLDENPIYINVVKHATKQKSKSPERSQIRHARNKAVDENKSKNEGNIGIKTAGGKSNRDITLEKHNTGEDMTRKSTRVQQNKHDSNFEPSLRTPIEETKREKSMRLPEHETKILLPENDNRYSSPKQNQRSRSTQRRSPKLENFTDKRTTSHDRNNKHTRKDQNEENIIKPSHVKTQVKDKKCDDRVNSLSSNTNSSRATDTKSKGDKQKRTRDKSGNLKRREYVINYDDTNGTMSSVCKVKTGTSKTRVVHPAKEAHLDQGVSKSSTIKLSLKYQGQHSTNKYCDSHNFRRIYKQRTCTIL